jgi:hypothetical protein
VPYKANATNGATIHSARLIRRTPWAARVQAAIDVLDGKEAVQDPFPKITTDQNTPLPEKFVHYTNGEDLVISTNVERVFPHTISLGDPNSDKSDFDDPEAGPEAGLRLYGKNGFEVTLKPGLKILRIDVEEKERDFWNLGDWGESHHQGMRWCDYAKRHGYDGIYATHVPGAGNELALFDLKNIASKTRMGAGDAASKKDAAKTRLIETVNGTGSAPDELAKALADKDITADDFAHSMAGDDLKVMGKPHPSSSSMDSSFGYAPSIGVVTNCQDRDGKQIGHFSRVKGYVP